MKAIRLRTEYLKNPMGIDIRHPRLMWNCGDWNELENAAGAKQTAYQIVTDKWDSGNTTQVVAMSSGCGCRRIRRSH